MNLNLRKVCRCCRESKPITEFPRKKSTRDGLSPWCSPCNTAKLLDWRKRNPEKFARSSTRRRYRKYGLEIEDVERMMERQGQKCAICDKPFTDTRPHLDHDHATGEVRGMLCTYCNVGLAHIEKSGWLDRALGYLYNNPGDPTMPRRPQPRQASLKLEVA